MAAPKGEFTPSKGPLAGQTYPSYYRYQVARSQALYGFTSYRQEKVAKVAIPNEAMWRVYNATAQANGATRNQAVNKYLQLRSANGGKQPRRVSIASDLRDEGWLDQDSEPDWGEAS